MYKFNEEKHIHLMDGKPLIGTSTVCGVIAKTLTWWAAGLALKDFGWLNSKEHSAADRILWAGTYLKKIGQMTVPEYLKLLDNGYKAHSNTLKEAAEGGTDMHAELEFYVKWKMGIGLEGDVHLDLPAVQTFDKWATENVKQFLVSEGHCWSKEHWLGGIMDLMFEDKNGNLAIMDFKSAKQAYDTHFIQIAGYDIQVAENGTFDKDGVPIYKPERSVSYYAVFPFGMKNPAPQFRYNVKELKDGFLAALVLHKIINK